MRNKARISVIVTVFVITLLFISQGCVKKLPFGTISFKPFTLKQLLTLDLEIDAAHSGVRVASQKTEELTKRVSLLRELPLKKKVPFIKTREEVIRAILLQEQTKEESPREIDADQKILVALGLFPEGKSLRETLTNVLTEQIAGSYDSEAKVITVVSGKGTNSTMDEITTAHEITHALQDQNFNLEKPPLKDESYNSDTELAITSLIEGDATNVMAEYAKEYIPAQELLKMMQETGEMSSKELNKAPEYVRRSLLFPYEEGLAFVRSLLSSKGLEGLNAAFRDPPTSSEQIIHPEKYFVTRENPKPVKLSDISGSLGKNWKLLETEIMGEFDVEVWFEVFCGLLSSREVAQGWAGNSIQYYQGPRGESAVVNYFLWDSPSDAHEFFTNYSELLEKRFKKGLKKDRLDTSYYVMKTPKWNFYCGICGESTLAVQTTKPSTLKTVISNFPLFPQI